MPCYRLVAAHRDRSGNGDVRIGRSPEIDQGDGLELPCGRCIGCLQARRRSWALRIVHESMLWPVSRFATLTYDDDHLESPSLQYRDFQLFMKRLRKFFAERKVRFFACGEYGKHYRRPHFHAILFNVKFDDEAELLNGSKRSEAATRLWGKGAVHLGEVSPASAAYVAGYTVDKTYGQAASTAYDHSVNVRTGELDELRPEFVTMSRRPGIGASWFDKYSSDVLPRDYAVDVEGRKWAVPRYYREKFDDRVAREVSETVKELRWLRAMQMPASEKSEERLAVREELAQRRATRKERKV